MPIAGDLGDSYFSFKPASPRRSADGRGGRPRRPYAQSEAYFSSPMVQSPEPIDDGIMRRDFGTVRVIPPPDEKISNVDRDTDVVFDKAVIGHILGIGGDFEAAFEWVVKTSWEEILTNVGFDISHNSVFDQFQEKLGTFTVKARSIGRSFGLLTAARKLRDEIPNLEIILEENAAHLFETYRTFHYPRNELNPPRSFWTKDARDRNLHLGASPKHIHNFAMALKEFRGRVNEFSVWDDGSLSLKTCLHVLEHDLRDWSNGLADNSCCSVYSILLQVYLYQRGIEISRSLKQITVHLDNFITTGIPAIQDGQKRTDVTLGNISTGATFFSAVTATMLQISYSVNFVPIITVVNTLWYISLVLSIGAALNSVLAMAWRQSIHGSRGRQLPIWVTLWIHGSSLVCLVISIVAFSAGLVLFTFASQQHAITSSLTLVLTLLTTFGIAIIGFWMLSERLYALRLAKPSIGVLEHDLSLVESPALGYFSGRKGARPGKQKKADGDDDTSVGGSTIEQASDDSDDGYEAIEVPNFLPLRDLLQQTRMRMNSMMTSRERLQAHTIEDNVENSSVARARSNWHKVSKLVKKRDPRLIFRRATPTLLPVITENQEIRTIPSAIRATGSTSRSRESRKTAVSHLSKPQPGMPKFMAEVDISGYGVIQHISVSPDGSSVAITCFRETAERDSPKSSVSTTLIYQITGDRQFTIPPKSCDHRPKIKTRQVIWSPEGTIVLVRQNIGILLWNLTTGKHEVISKSATQSIIWYGTEKAFLCAERSRLVKRRWDGTKIWIHPLPNLNMRDITWVSPNELAIVAHVICPSEEHGPPSTSRPTEKRILIYDVEQPSGLAPWKPLSPVATVPTSYIPTLENARYITSSHTGRILVSYRSKLPPQVFSIPTRDASERGEKHDLSLKTTYKPMPVEFRGPSYATKNGSLALCSLKGSELHIWSPSTGETIMCFKPHEEEGSSDAPLGAWGSIEDGRYTLITGQGSKLKLWHLRPPFKGYSSTVSATATPRYTNYSRRGGE